jgi:hypothetical protein
MTDTRYVAGHPIANRDDRCITCGRSVHDVMSSYDSAQVGDKGVACVGSLNAAEIDQMAEESKRRSSVWDALVGVVG